VNPVRDALILLVRLYRVTLSPAKTFLFGPAAQCRFEPSCSQYAIRALKTHGALAGGWLAAKRVCRCHPWGKCGEDPVPQAKSKVQGVEDGLASVPPGETPRLYGRRDARRYERAVHREVHV